jgi:hypothetical protein
MKLDQLREKSEKDFKILTVVDQYGNYSRVLVVLELKNGKYRCHRYINHNKTWSLEVDWYQANINTVFSWLSFPTVNKSVRNRNTCPPSLPLHALRKTNFKKTIDI